MTTTTQTAKVAAALINGAELTARQISSRYGVKMFVLLSVNFVQKVFRFI